MRFDRFNDKYKLGGSDLLKTVFLKTSGNLIKGRYIAEITKEMMDIIDK